jgi:hypothetical protein
LPADHPPDAWVHVSAEREVGRNTRWSDAGSSHALGHFSQSITNVCAHLLDDDGADGHLFTSPP